VLPYAALLPLAQGLDVVLDGLLNYSLPVTVVDQETVTREDAELRVQRLEFPTYPKFPAPYLPRNAGVRFAPKAAANATVAYSISQSKHRRRVAVLRRSSFSMAFGQFVEARPSGDKRAIN
jgi:hypothetical protein